MRRDLRERLGAFVALLHPAPIAVVLLAAIGFAVAAARGRPPTRRLGRFLASLLLTQIAISLHNDYCDRALDARAKPWRALPRGLVAPDVALGGALALFVGGVAAARPLGRSVAALVAIGTGAGFAYNARFKRSRWTWLPFWIALPSLPVGSFLAMGRFAPRLFLAYLIGAPLVLGVYLADSLPDVEADRVQGLRGLAPRLGTRRARRVCWLSLALAIVLALVTRPRARRPGPLYLVALAALGAAVAFGRDRPGAGQW